MNEKVEEEKNWNLFFDFSIEFIEDQVSQYKHESNHMGNAWKEIKDRFDKKHVIGKNY